ncbi:IS66 family insertion sequence element accessory protein TnpA [Nitrincola alkalilacustris]|uniref:IS66 family insertion sequence element accessory protein TnpA n=1 Tax=Nitrincola alkalilacustris TaxID=1571224 RepID=UPI00124BFA68|nr:IS66 family insertion sequence element accessory protein TnpB [Nitrincola alkalilacustris]
MTTHERQQYWQQQMADWQASNLSGAAFCKQHALSYHQFVYWRQKLLNDEDTPPEVKKVGFARVAPLQSPGSAAELTLSLPGGVSITGLHAGNIDLLGAILRQL